MSAFPKVKLSYFDIEGLAEKVRLTLKVGGVPFEDHRVSFPEWATLQATTPHGQLPILHFEDGSFGDVTQSGAMLRWAGRLTGLYPTDVTAQLLVDEAIGLEEDLGRALMPSMYLARKPTMYGHPADLSEERVRTMQLALRAALIAPGGDLPRFLGYLDAALAKNNATRQAGDSGPYFFVGDSVTIADCQIFPRLSHLRLGVLDGIPPTIVDSFPNLSRFYKTFAALPAVKAHYEAREAAKKAATA
jgi:glutathione S-transferase